MDKNQNLNKQSIKKKKNNNKFNKKYININNNNELIFNGLLNKNNKINNYNSKISHLKTFSYSKEKDSQKNKEEKSETSIKSNNIDTLYKRNNKFINLSKIYNNEKVKQRKKKLILKTNSLFQTLDSNNSADNLFTIESIEKTNKNFDKILPIKKEDYLSTLFIKNESTDRNNTNKFNNHYLTENNSFNSNLVLSEKKSKLNNYLTEETDIEYLNKLNERHNGKKLCSKQTLTQEQYYEIDQLIEKDNYRRIKEKKLKEMDKINNMKNNKKLNRKKNNTNNNNDNSTSFRSNNECDICALDSKNCVIL
jgi:hypothetical protein